MAFMRRCFLAAPLDDNSVSSLVALDSAVEAVAARVSPAVVNVAVTSRGWQSTRRRRAGSGPGAGSATEVFLLASLSSSDRGPLGGADAAAAAAD